MLGLIVKAFGFISSNYVIILVISLISTGTLLANEYKHKVIAEDRLNQELELRANLEELVNKRNKEYADLVKKQEKRDRQQVALNRELNGLRSTLRGLKDESKCIDADLGDDFSRLLSTTKGENSERLPSKQ